MRAELIVLSSHLTYLSMFQDASYRRAPPSPDRFSPLRDGEAPGTIDHDGFVKSICVSLEKKIAETTREQRTLQLVGGSHYCMIAMAPYQRP